MLVYVFKGWLHLCLLPVLPLGVEGRLYDFSEENLFTVGVISVELSLIYFVDLIFSLFFAEAGELLYVCEISLRSLGSSSVIH